MNKAKENKRWEQREYKKKVSISEREGGNLNPTTLEKRIGLT